MPLLGLDENPAPKKLISRLAGTQVPLTSFWINFFRYALTDGHPHIVMGYEECTGGQDCPNETSHYNS